MHTINISYHTLASIEQIITNPSPRQENCTNDRQMHNWRYIFQNRTKPKQQYRNFYLKWSSFIGHILFVVSSCFLLHDGMGKVGGKSGKLSQKIFILKHDLFISCCLMLQEAYVILANRLNNILVLQQCLFKKYGVSLSIIL